MPRIALLSGAYTSRGLLASAQRCCNLYQEATPQIAQPPTPVTHLPTPGLTLLAQPRGAGYGRAIYRASTGAVYAVIGSDVYLLINTPNTAFWSFTLLGSIQTDSPTPVSIKDNEQTAFLVDGSRIGYTIDLLTNRMSVVTDLNFPGADRVDYLDTFLIFNRPGTPGFYSTLSNVTTFDPLYFADMTGEPTNCVAVVTMRGYIWVIGERATEIWFDAGDTNVFPFARMPGQVIQHGCLATYSVALSSGDDDTQSAVLWLAQNEDGGGILLKGQNFQMQRVSTHAIEDEWRKYPKLTDAIGYCYQQGGHSFYVITFPAADRTWSYDLTSSLATGMPQWHERPYIDNDGIEHRHRASCTAYAAGVNLCLDWENGSLYKFDLDNFTDNFQPIVRRRGFPHSLNDGKRMLYTRFIADMATGNDIGMVDGTDYAHPPLVSLRYSDDHGRTWGNPIKLSLGAVGEYNRSMLATRLGMARDRVFEVYWSGGELTALNGAFVEPVELAS